MNSHLIVVIVDGVRESEILCDRKDLDVLLYIRTRVQLKETL